ncbi:hypothetical protein ACTG9Q_32870 [Actinokineospora sp. 24-640]
MFCHKPFSRLRADAGITKLGGTTVLVLTGTVIDGLFQGVTVVQTKVLPATDLTARLTPQGLTSVSGTVTFTAAL